MTHLIFVCKYRKKLLVKFGNEIKQIFYDIADEAVVKECWALSNLQPLWAIENLMKGARYEEEVI